MAGEHREQLVAEGDWIDVAADEIAGEIGDTRLADANSARVADIIRDHVETARGAMRAAAEHGEATARTVDAMERWKVPMSALAPHGQGAVADTVIARVQQLLRGMPSDDLRLEAIAVVCRFCGGLKHPCACTRDE